MTINIGKRSVGNGHPVYFIADIAANHDGELNRAVDLIHKAAAAGADAAKFQHFRAETIVSKEGFDSMTGQLSHQARWKKSVFEVYKGASVPWDWTPALKQACCESGIEFLSTPYDLDVVDMLDPFVLAYKVGSGDITWLEELEYIAHKGKPVLLATGASDIGEVQRAVRVVRALNPQLVLMQCNTNYTGSLENFKYIHLNVLKTFAAIYPDMVLGLSDHTPGHVSVLGAIALGARVIEKHFTDDCGRQGPDHPFSLDPIAWCEMVARTRDLEAALGDGEKRVQENEADTVVIQRRCLRAAVDISEGSVLSRRDIAVLRPAPADAISPCDINGVVGLRVCRSVPKGDYLRWIDIC
ncbi:MAG: N-acetylneuraminate synthase family protein [Verrucomicrobia bacterium]|nr:N-acetylneuraminate synthase family protein [Verrucomicrobiota bacterium]